MYTDQHVSDARRGLEFLKAILGLILIRGKQVEYDHSYLEINEVGQKTIGSASPQPAHHLSMSWNGAISGTSMSTWSRLSVVC